MGHSSQKSSMKAEFDGQGKAENQAAWTSRKNMELLENLVPIF